LGYLRFSILRGLIHRHYYWRRFRRFGMKRLLVDRLAIHHRSYGSFAYLLRGFLGDSFDLELLHLVLEGFSEAGQDKVLNLPPAAVSLTLHEIVQAQVFGANEAQLDPPFTLS
jgi:hypothetical protein